MSRWEKLIRRIRIQDKNLRFDELAKVLRHMGYTADQPRGGSSHYVFRKPGKQHITISKASPTGKAYIEMVRDAVSEHEGDEN